MNIQEPSEYIRAFGQNLKKIRSEKNLSQEELAYKAGLTLSQIGRIERGVINTSIRTVYIISKALEIRPGALFTFVFDDSK